MLTKMKKKGFTLVELLVVIAILAILATAGIVGYTAFTKSAKESVVRTKLVQLRTVLILEDGENDAFTIGDDKITFVEAYYVKSVDDGTYSLTQEGDYTVEKTTDNDTNVKALFAMILKGNNDLKDYADNLSIENSEYLTVVSDGSNYTKVTLKHENGDHDIIATWTIGSSEITVETEN